MFLPVLYYIKAVVSPLCGFRSVEKMNTCVHYHHINFKLLHSLKDIRLVKSLYSIYNASHAIIFLDEQ